MADINTNTVIMDGPQKYVASFVHTYVDTGEGTPVKKIDVSGLYSFAKSNCSFWNNTFTKVLAGTG